jgi:hypothetical protein
MIPTIFPIASATQNLNKFRMCSARFASYSLRRVNALLTVYRALQKLYPRKYKKMLGPTLAYLRITDITEGHDLEDVERAMVRVLESLFPLYADWFTELLAEGELLLVFEPMGPYMCWDDFESLIENLDSWNNSDYWQFFMFITVLEHIEYIDAETWSALAEYFRWPVKTMPEMPEDVYLDAGKFQSYLIRKKVDAETRKEFWLAQQMVWRDTGNFLFDMEPENEFNPADQMIPFTVENILASVRVWKKGQKLETQIMRVIQKYRKDLSILNLYLEAYLYALTPRTQKGGSTDEEDE